LRTGRQRSIGALLTVAPALGEIIAALFDVRLAFSTTLTVKAADEALARRSRAEQVTVVVPTGNREPEAGAQLTATGPSTTSDAAAPNSTTRPVRVVVETVRAAFEPYVHGAEVSFVAACWMIVARAP